MFRLPATAVVHEIRDSSVWVVELDKLDVPAVTRYSLRPSAR
jgi:hypothetical protein